MQRYSTIRKHFVFFASLLLTWALFFGLFLSPMAAQAQDAPKLKIATN